MQYFIQIILLAIILWPAAASAAQPCTNPAGDEGDQVYNTTYHVMQYCNGTNWVAMGSHAGSGGGSDNLGDHTAAQALDMGGFRIENLAAPTAGDHAATRAYADGKVGKTGDTMTGTLVISPPAYLSFGSGLGDKITWWGNQFGTGIEQDTLTHWANHHHRWRLGGTSVSSGAEAMVLDSATLDVKTKKIVNVGTPTANTDAATKQYVDSVAAGGGDGLPACTQGQIAVRGASAWECLDYFGVCDGLELAGACWILAPPATSCASVCAARGGYSDVTRSYAGSGGNNTTCHDMLQSLLEGGLAFEEETSCEDESISLGLGCFIMSGQIEGMNVMMGSRCATPTTTAEASFPSIPDGEGGYMDIRRACACNSGAPF